MILLSPSAPHWEPLQNLVPWMPLLDECNWGYRYMSTTKGAREWLLCFAQGGMARWAAGHLGNLINNWLVIFRPSLEEFQKEITYVRWVIPLLQKLKEGSYWFPWQTFNSVHFKCCGDYRVRRKTGFWPKWVSVMVLSCNIKHQIKKWSGPLFLGRSRPWGPGAE